MPTWFNRYNATLTKLTMAVCLFLIPFKILSYGYMPKDDVLRHVAKTLSEKAWHDILILDESIYSGMDTHPGWHSILNTAHQLGISTPDGLIIFSVVILWLLATIPPLFYFKRPEGFILAMLIVFLCDFNPVYRLLWGRPYIITISAIIALLHLSNQYTLTHNKQKLNFFIILISTLAAWIQSAFYLLYAVPVALFFSRHYRDSVKITLAITLGIALASILSLHPIDYPVYQLKHLFAGLIHPTLTRAIVVDEFGPGRINPLMLLAVLNLMVFALIQNKKPNQSILTGPAFILAMIGLAGGFFVWRLWTDVGFPAFLYWCTKEIDMFLQKNSNQFSFRRLIFVGILCAVMFQTFTLNTDSRWSKNNINQLKLLAQKLEQIPNWLPEEDGVLYSPSMGVFFNIFYLYPKANWKYALGFEPGIMSKENAEIHSRIEREQTFQSLEPWIQKMLPADRLIIPSNAERIPPIKELQWKRVPPSYWIGKK